jgi:histidinol-phosphate aminotransferase
MPARPSVRDDLRALEGYHSPQVDVAVRLNTNEAPWPPPAEWSARLADAVRHIEFHRYPDRAAGELRARIAALHGRRPEEVFVANGSNEVLQTLLLAYAGSGRSVLTFEPTYQLHGHIARLTGATTVEVERRADFTIDTERAVDAVRATGIDVVFLCSPNNPTGTVEPRASVEAISAASSGLVIVDEAYGQFADWSALELFDAERPLVISRTFSKTWSLAGVRLGYCIAPEWVVAELDKVVLPYHLDALKQIAGILALDYVTEMEDRVAAIVNGRNDIVSALTQLGVEHWPSGANFVLFRPAVADVWAGLVARGVLVRNCGSWPRLSGCLRVTVGTPEENERFIAALTEVLG